MAALGASGSVILCKILYNVVFKLGKKAGNREMDEFMEMEATLYEYHHSGDLFMWTGVLRAADMFWNEEEK